MPRGPGSCPQGPALASALGSRVPRGGPGLCCCRRDPRPGSGSPGPGSQAVTHPIRASVFLLENGVITMAPEAARRRPGCVAAEHRAGGTEPVGTGGLDPCFLRLGSDTPPQGFQVGGVHSRAARVGPRGGPPGEAAPWRGRLGALHLHGRAGWTGAQLPGSFSERGQQAPGAPSPGSSADCGAPSGSRQHRDLRVPGPPFSAPRPAWQPRDRPGGRWLSPMSDCPEPIAES